MSLKDVPNKVEQNLKARKDSAVGAARGQVGIVKGTVQKQIGIGKDAINQLLQLKPVPAVIDTVTGTINNVADLGTDSIDNLGDAIKDQAKITRDWFPDVDLRRRK